MSDVDRLLSELLDSDEESEVSTFAICGPVLKTYVMQAFDCARRSLKPALQLQTKIRARLCYQVI